MSAACLVISLRNNSCMINNVPNACKMLLRPRAFVGADIDDKIIARAQQSNEDPLSLSRRYSEHSRVICFRHTKSCVCGRGFICLGMKACLHDFFCCHFDSVHHGIKPRVRGVALLAHLNTLNCSDSANTRIFTLQPACQNTLETVTQTHVAT